MKTFTLPGTDIVVPNVVLGLMRIADKSDDEIRELVRTGRDAGITMVDHADIYGGAMHVCERRFAEAMRLTPADRAEIVLDGQPIHVQRNRTDHTGRASISVPWGRLAFPRVA